MASGLGPGQTFAKVYEKVGARAARAKFRESWGRGARKSASSAEGRRLAAPITPLSARWPAPVGKVGGRRRGCHRATAELLPLGPHGFESTAFRSSCVPSLPAGLGRVGSVRREGLESKKLRETFARKLGSDRAKERKKVLGDSTKPPLSASALISAPIHSKTPTKGRPLYVQSRGEPTLKRSASLSRGLGSG